MSTAYTHHPRHVDEFRFDPTRTYEQPVGGAMKPKGFWLSVDGDWERWCTDEEMSWLSPEPVSFDLDVDRCLLLDSVEKLDRFHAEYVGDQDGYRVDWRPLTDQYAGVVIAPYQWSRRLSDIDWYYSWDCASACIWDLSAVRVSESVSA